MNKKSLTLAITSLCNLRCFYCRKNGENLEGCEGTIDYDFLKRIIRCAYEEGFEFFRITGGEPTLINNLGDIIEYILSFSKTKVRITTNGFNIEKYYNLLQKYNNRVEVVISVDSLYENVGDIKFDKFLSNKILQIINQLKNRNIAVRFNIVVTQYNKNQVLDLIKKALDLKVNVKVLDLIERTDFFNQENSHDFFVNSFEPLNELEQVLKTSADRVEENFNLYGENGIPMTAYFFDKNWVLVKNSLKGTTYCGICQKECSNFKNCQDGLYSVFVTNNGILTPSNCVNPKMKWDLLKQSDMEIKKSFKEICECFDDATLYNNFG